MPSRACVSFICLILALARFAVPGHGEETPQPSILDLLNMEAGIADHVWNVEELVNLLGS
jgi:hypothetical protein